MFLFCSHLLGREKLWCHGLSRISSLAIGLDAHKFNLFQAPACVILLYMVCCMCVWVSEVPVMVFVFSYNNKWLYTTIIKNLWIKSLDSIIISWRFCACSVNRALFQGISPSTWARLRYTGTKHGLGNGSTTSLHPLPAASTSAVRRSGREYRLVGLTLFHIHFFLIPSLPWWVLFGTWR